ncbi:MAG: cyclic pyranopterin monophosphate synthase MoaC [Ignavibacteriales bacterium]|nr:cyclic pyranopterin monophosphate synthase MoaC [Ignavibacteriales bacterium]
MKKLTHTDENGKANMVDVSSKDKQIRSAHAFAEVLLPVKVFRAIKKNLVAKGDVLTVAKIAGIQAAKKTFELIPLCHNIFISKVDVFLSLNSKNRTVEIKASVLTTDVTGIEMEALTAVSVAALTVYDMCKAIDKGIIISGIKLLSKTGGKSGDYFFSEAKLLGKEIKKKNS